MEYAITPQYHEKKGTEIYVLRLLDKVDRDTFMELSQLAKKHKGYYSSFRGVNGFVFKTEEAAETFGSQISVIIGLETFNATPSAEEEPVKPIKNKKTKSTIEPKFHMSLREALRYVVETEGLDILNNPRLVNMLDDFHAFDEFASAKYILRAVIGDKYTTKLLAVGAYNENAIKLANHYSSTTGFMPNMVEAVFRSIAFGVKWIEDYEDFPGIEGQTSISTPGISKGIKSRKTPLTPNNQNTSEEKDHLQFMGLPICGKVNKFEKVLLKRGFHGFGNDKYSFMGPFVGLENCWCRFTASSFSNEIWKVEVNTDSVQTDAVKNKNTMYKHYIRIRDLYTKKYGLPISSDNYEIGVDGDWESIASSDFCAEETSTFHLPLGTITIKLTSWGINITYEDKSSYELHEHLAEQSSTEDI